MSNTLTKKEALEAIDKGLTVRHESFHDFEWVRKYNGNDEVYEFEDSVKFPVKLYWEYRQHGMWDEGWYIVSAPKYTVGQHPYE